MTRVSRMLLIVLVMGLLGLSALYFIAGRFRDMDEARQTEPAEQPLVPIPADAGETAADVAGEAVEPVRDEVQASGALVDQLKVFADARQAVMDVLNKYPKVRDSFRKEMTGTMEDDARVRMYNYEMVELRIARSRPLQAAGMSEEEYKTIRDQYRAYRSGEGEVDPEWRRAFEAAPEEVMARADLGEYDRFDY